MTASLSVAVMAHPKREAMVNELLDWLDWPATVAWDQVNDRHDTGARAMGAFDPGCSHHLVVQDDVVPCRDLVAGAERALERTPGDVPVSLYVGTARPFGPEIAAAVRFAGGHSSWLIMEGLYWGPAVIVPTPLIPPMLAWYARSTLQNYDRRMSGWFQRQGLPTWYTWPSLVDHRGDDSLVHNAAPGRRAHRFAGRDFSALDLEWTGGIVQLVDTDKLDAKRQRAAKRAVRA